MTWSKKYFSVALLTLIILAFLGQAAFAGPDCGKTTANSLVLISR